MRRVSLPMHLPAVVALAPPESTSRLGSPDDVPTPATAWHVLAYPTARRGRALMSVVWAALVVNQQSTGGK